MLFTSGNTSLNKKAGMEACIIQFKIHGVCCVFGAWFQFSVEIWILASCILSRAHGGGSSSVSYALVLCFLFEHGAFDLVSLALCYCHMFILLSRLEHFVEQMACDFLGVIIANLKVSLCSCVVFFAWFK